jgi:hypothetical protein
MHGEDEGEENAYRMWVGKPSGGGGEAADIYQDNIKSDLTEILCTGSILLRIPISSGLF